MYIARVGRSLGTPPPKPPQILPRSTGWRGACGDVTQGAKNGFLYTCAGRAGLSGLGVALSQAELSRATKAFSSKIHPFLLSSKLYKRGLGDDSGFVFATGPNAGMPATGYPISSDAPPDPMSISQIADQINSAPPTFVSPMYQAPLPTVSPSTLLAAAALPGAPAVVQQAAAQYSAANPFTAWFSGSMIGGIPNYILLAGAGAALLLLMGLKGRR